MLGALTSLITDEPFDALRPFGVPTRTGPTMPRLAPFGVYGATDGYVAICAFTDPFAHALFRAMDRPGAARRSAVRHPRHARAARQRDGRVRGTVDAGSKPDGHPGDARAGTSAVRGGAASRRRRSAIRGSSIAATRCRSRIRYTAAWRTSTAPACPSPSPRRRRASTGRRRPSASTTAGLRRSARLFAGTSRRTEGDRSDLGCTSRPRRRTPCD